MATLRCVVSGIIGGLLLGALIGACVVIQTADGVVRRGDFLCEQTAARYSKTVSLAFAIALGAIGPWIRPTVYGLVAAVAVLCLLTSNGIRQSWVIANR